jgi:peroxiredoxin
MKKFLFLIVAAFLIATANAQDPKGLNVNDDAPDFTGKDQNGKSIHLKSLLKKGPVVLVFYRGEWCPYCNKHLKSLEDSLLFITDKGASLVTVTPEKQEYIAKTIEKTKASYPIIHDTQLKIMKSYGVSFAVPLKTIEIYKKHDLDFTVINGEANGANLPVPALYIIKKGKITFRYFDPNYKNRATVQDILGNL